MNEKFDINAWQEQGKKALETLQSKKADLEIQLEKVCDEIFNVEAALGISPARQKRVRLRPLILGQAEANKGKAVPVEVVVQAVKENLTVEVTDDSIITAITRAVKDVDGLVLDEKGLMLKK